MNEAFKHKIFTNDIKIKRALISVTDKKGIDILAKELASLNIEILSTGGTAKFLEENGILVKDVSEETGFPEILNGRVKTLHPNIHGGILGRRNNANHIKKMQEHNIVEIDLLIINLYKFTETVKKTHDNSKIIENIDIGGPAMIRSAAKNYQHVAVLTNPEDYKFFTNEINKNQGSISLDLSFSLANIKPEYASIALYRISCSVFKSFASAKLKPILLFCILATPAKP